MTTQTTQTTTTRGRPLSKRGRDTKRAVARFLETHEGQFTAADVRKASKQNKVTVRNHLNALEAAGVIKKVGHTAVIKAGKVVRGRPLAVYVQNTEYVKPVSQRTREHRAFVRQMSALSFRERSAYVAQALVHLYEKQLEDEKATRDSHHLNAQGFTKYDALRGCVDAETLLSEGYITMEQVNYWLQPVSKDGRSRIGKYHRQLTHLTAA